MTIHQEVSLNSDKLFNDLLDTLGPDEFIKGIVNLCAGSSAEDFLLEKGIITAMEKFIKDNS